MFLITSGFWPQFPGVSPRNAGFAVVLTVAVALLAWGIRSVNTGGAIAGSALTLIMLFAAGIRVFAGIAAVFALAWASTRFDYQRKQQLGTAEKPTGRSASQIAANLGVPAAMAVLGLITRAHTAFMVALVAALAEAAADTVSSECGQAISREARLITTWAPVPAGVDGAISLPGTAAGIAAAISVVLVCSGAGLISFRQSGYAVVAGVLGMLADSYLGALLQRRGKLNNDGVNFLSTLAAAAIGLVCALAQA
jgi:uncharacterized protein (TIGR00297 family)